MNAIVVTGDRPTGQLHLGHYVGSLTQRLELQHTHETFIIIADTQVLNNNLLKAQDVKKNTLSLMRDYLAVGLDPEKIHFVLQSEVPALFELTHYLSNLVTLPFVMRNPTIKSENKLYNSELTMGFLTYPIAQTADVILFNGELVPVGEDQKPILDFANDVVEKFHHHFKCSHFKKIQPLLSEYPRLMGIDGDNKMSKSLNNAIFLQDDEKTLKKKINQMYTDKNHLKISDPGQVEGHVVFSFLDVFLDDKTQLEELKSHYRKGGLGDSYLKGLLFNQLNNLLSPIRDNSYTDDYLLEILKEGTKYAQEKARTNMSQIKDLIFK